LPRKPAPDVLAIGGGFASLLVVAALAFVMALTSASADQSARHSLQVRRARAELLSAILDREARQRGYLLTGDRTYLATVPQAPQIEQTLQRLEILTRKNAGQQQRLAKLRQLLAAREAELTRTTELWHAGRSDEALAIVRSNAGDGLMRLIQLQLVAFDQAEGRLEQQHSASAASFRTVLLVATLVAVAFSCALGLLVLRTGRRYATELGAQNTALREEIASREQTEARLRQSQKMDAVGRLTGGVAHDFNNMLAVVLGNLDLASRQLPQGPSRVAPLLANAREGADRAAALTKQLLAFSRQQTLDPKSTDINNVVRSVSKMLRRTLGGDVEIETPLADGLWPAFIDRPQLESAIVNLAVNARDAMPDGGRLTIETQNVNLNSDYVQRYPGVAAGEYVLIAVTDNGSGMKPEVAEKVFDPFFTTKPPGKGTGLGLSQVHGFVKQSGGHVAVCSEVGVGTSIKLYLPRDRTVADVDERPAAPPPPPPPLDRSAMVLVVDDNASVRAFVVSAVRELGLKATEADCGAVALQLIRQDPEISLVLADVVMPSMSGRDLVEQAHAIRPDLKFIYMTGYTANAIAHGGALDAGAHLLTKPFTVEQLQRALAELIASAESPG